MLKRTPDLLAALRVGPPGKGIGREGMEGKGREGK